MKKEYKEVPLRNLFEDFIRECQFARGLRKDTLRGYSSTFATFIKVMPDLSTKNLNSSTMTEFFKCLKTRKRIVGRSTEKEGVKNSTIKTYWNKLSVFFEWLIREGYLEQDPFKGMTPPQAVYDDNKILTPEELSKIFSAISIDSENLLLKKRDTAMVSLLLYCGLRKTELNLLEGRDFNLEKKVLTVRGETSKSRKTRLLPIHSSLKLHLEDYIEERKKFGYKTQFFIVSNNKDRGLSKDGLKHWVKKLIKISGVKFHLHMFRHTFACNLASNNVSAVIIQRLMGHTDLRMTQRYLRSLGVEDLRDGIDSLDFL